MNRRWFILSVFSSIITSFFMTYEKKLTNLKKDNKKNLSSKELAVLTKTANLIYPGTDNSFNAEELGFKNFIINKIKRTNDKKIKSKLKTLAKSLTNLNNLSENISKLYVSEIYEGSIEDINLLTDLTIEACYSHPQYGGNKNRQTWKKLIHHFNSQWTNG